MSTLGIFFVGRGMLRIMRILVVEDEKKVASFIKRGLEPTHYSVDVEYDGEAGLKRLLHKPKHRPDNQKRGCVHSSLRNFILTRYDGLGLRATTWEEGKLLCRRENYPNQQGTYQDCQT